MFHRARFFVAAKVGVAVATVCVVIAAKAAETQVTLTDAGQSWVLTNGHCKATVSKRTGDLTSLIYKDIETLEKHSGHPDGYWEQQPANAVAIVTIDPATNDGQRAEVSVKGRAGGGAGGGTNNVDIEIRYTMGRDDSGIYTYAIFSHDAKSPNGAVGESRYGAKLAIDTFDWLSVDANRNRLMPTGADWDHGDQLNMKEARRLTTGNFKGEVDHKYDYSAYQFKIPAFGWSSTKKQIGFYLINPTIEFLSGGATKYELTGHLDNNQGGAPTILDYWRGTHYGGSQCSIPQGEEWSKVVGPILVYVNSKPTPDAMYADALAQAKKEAAAWPYDWVSGVDYPHKNERGTVSGQLVLVDDQAASKKLPNLLVGLAFPDQPRAVNAPAYVPQPSADEADSAKGDSGAARGDGAKGAEGAKSGDDAARGDGATRGNGAPGTGRGRGRGTFAGRGPGLMDWQNDAKHYQFWVQGDENGNFTIANVRPGKYQLHAIADGVLGEFSEQPIEVKAGEKLDLGKLEWKPVRYGKQVWEIGIPNRQGSEFFKGDDYYHWGWYVEYPKLFPNDVKFEIGKSDYRKDWFFEQVPHDTNPNNTTGQGQGRATPWSITFNMPEAPHGKATFRLAICGSGTRSIDVTVNDSKAGSIAALAYNATINRDGIGGYWSERTLAFDASLLKQGKNELVLTIPAGGLTSGVIYDYLRLELDENSTMADAK